MEITQTKPNIQAYAATFECLINNKKETCSTGVLQELSNQFFSNVSYYIYLCLLFIILIYYYLL